jgi:hypothetical protein
MQPSISFSAPYEWIVAPLLPGVLWALVGLCLLGMLVDLAASTSATRGRLASLCGALLLVVLGRGWFAFDSWTSQAFVLIATAVMIAHAARYGCRTLLVSDTGRSPLWIGFAIIIASSAIKCIDLDWWPVNLNTYSAMTGEEGLRALEGKWPSPFFGIRAYPLAEGGQSPLHLPILFASMTLFGGTTLAVRFAEVVGSTLLLVMLWLWVRAALPRPWAATALAVFAFSPWHLMQSRFGTFYSLSAALSLALLWLAERTRDDRGRTWQVWIAFGVATVAISWAYAPLQVLYPFVFAVVGAGVLQRRRWQPLLAAGVFALVTGSQLLQGGNALMRSHFGQLATDTVIWRKTAAGVVTRETQPLAVVIDNLAHNAQLWFRESLKDVDILIWWAPALVVGFIYALWELWRPTSWMRSAYFLIGMLPPLLIFPLHRRTLIVWPLVYVAGTRFCSDLVEAAKECRGQPWMGRVAAVTVAVALTFSSLHGLRSYAIGNPATLVYPYFGTPHTHRMIDEAKRLLPKYDLLFVNPGIIGHVITVELYEPARAIERQRPYELVTVRESDDFSKPVMRGGRKKCFIYLNDKQHEGIAQRLQADLPDGKLVERRGESPTGPPLYSLYFFPSE